jgi:hypothetical protein
MALVFLLVFQEPLNYGGIYNKSQMILKKALTYVGAFLYKMSRPEIS